MKITLLGIYIFVTLTTFGQSFTKVTSGSIVTTNGDSRSVNLVDLDGNNFIDCFISNGLYGGQNNFLYINDGTGNFIQILNDTITRDHAPSDGATFADIDNDGDLDAFVVNWYGIDNLLYRNDGTGNFTRITGTAPASDGGYSETAAWGDYDNDGLVDLYVTNSDSNLINYLYHNDGNFNFTRVLSGPQSTDNYHSRCANWIDIDMDGDEDLFVTNENGENENLYKNDGGTFTKITGTPLVNDGGNTMSSSWADIDNDGDFDVLLANDQGNNSLFRNNGNFNFTKLTTDTVSKSAGNSFSSTWSDFENDGDLDLMVTNCFHTPGLQKNFMYINDGTGAFTRINTAIPATDLSWSYGCATGDLDNDGYEDLVAATVRFGGLDKPDLVYHNDGGPNHWITIKLAGINTNSAAIGVKVRLKAMINGQAVWQLREVSAQSAYCSQNDLRVHFGLGNANQIDSILVIWPGSTTEAYTSLQTDQFITIIEGQGVGINSFEENSIKIKIYPNPVIKDLNFEFNFESEYDVRFTIIDSLGKKVISGKLNKTFINVEELIPGSYGLILESKTKKYISNFIKK